ncbi:hypothetical protein COCSUDRAFT_52565 [Coccomyxa subellipsoidea C-169]|uniref:Uncharacterized protein n=1 Tax=Coccomyxa subellipsoidea (strain C-169) TaxID=574566 RepID=I0Z543_COCSC|nr:hypothetical protein COCSUDRAFT_52565 [Coccomyxa subellipsoidea C-169]EIE25762.1 hypothetical protein COCSUDRAFT_52565 [Coccomyxa subellipsoidea C-169]|eukprot:XP_005650306.1 hypothetical protein COCSUDRAFT_52565 [Coccomyxa subellipsoidea C-169]
MSWGRSWTSPWHSWTPLLALLLGCASCQWPSRRLSPLLTAPSQNIPPGAAGSCPPMAARSGARSLLLRRLWSSLEPPPSPSWMAEGHERALENLFLPFSILLLLSVASRAEGGTFSKCTPAGL